jgi:hypothetical protein
LGIQTSEFLADRPWEEVELDPLLRDLATRPPNGKHFPLLRPLVRLLLGPPGVKFSGIREKWLRVQSLHSSLAHLDFVCLTSDVGIQCWGHMFLGFEFLGVAFRVQGSGLRM